MKTFSLSVFVVVAVFASGCCNSLVHTRVTNPNAAPTGVRWTESRQYDVYVFVGGDQAVINDANGDLIVTNKIPKSIYVGTHDLLECVNGTVIDPNRSTWEVNYSAMPFADGGLELTFGDDGTPTVIKATGKSGTAGAVTAATTAIKAQDDIKTAASKSNK